MDYLTAKEKAVKYIGLSKKTENEVRHKLERSNVDYEIIDNVIEDLVSMGYINDIAYANLYIKQCVKEMKRSKREIAQKLLQKGIKECIIKDSLNNIEQDYDERLKNYIIETKSKNLDENKLNKYLYNKGLIDYKEWD